MATTPPLLAAEANPDDQVITLEGDPLDHCACNPQQACPYSGLAHAVSSTKPNRFILDSDRIRSGVRRNSITWSGHPRKVQETRICRGGWSGRGLWLVCNLEANPEVLVQVGRRRFAARAEPVRDVEARRRLARRMLPYW